MAITPESALRELIREAVRDAVREVLRDELAKGVAVPSKGEGPGQDGRLWDVHDAAEFLGVSESWLYHQSAAGKVPCIRVGHNLRFDPEALKAWTKGERRGGRVVALR